MAVSIMLGFGVKEAELKTAKEYLVELELENPNSDLAYMDWTDADALQAFFDCGCIAVGEAKYEEADNITSTWLVYSREELKVGKIQSSISKNLKSFNRKSKGYKLSLYGITLSIIERTEDKKVIIHPAGQWKYTSDTGDEPASEYIVTIVYDETHYKMRAQADDGKHGVKWVQFPHKLREREGQQYRVDQLIYDSERDFYRVKGSIMEV